MNLCIVGYVGYATWYPNILKYLWKKNEVLYFCNPVPVDVQKHYERSSIVICLKIKSKPSALRANRSIVF